MKPKKNPQLELKRNSKLYFSIGMACVLLLAYMALEWKSYDKIPEWDIGLNDPNLLPPEEVPITIQKMELPKPKIQTPPEIKIADDEEKIEESVIEAEDTNQDTEIVDVEDIDGCR